MNILIDAQTLYTNEINRGIGTYFKQMIEQVLKYDFTGSFYILVTNDEYIEYFSLYVNSKLKLIQHKFANPQELLKTNRKRAHGIYSDTIDEMIKEYKIDIYWNPNPQMDNTILPKKSDSSNAQYTATLYDLIPLIMKDIYFEKWPDIIKKEYEEKLGILKHYDHFYPISENTKEDFINYAGFQNNKQSVVLCGVSEKFRYEPFKKRLVDDEYLLYIGGFDYRKNMFKSIEAFSLFMKKYNSEKIDYKFYVVCNLSDNAKVELLEYATELNIQDSLVLTGFVEDEELYIIYKKARAFFFPSLYEGFGLPVLEALSSGLPIACSNNSSIPEVAKEYGSYFNPENIEEMAKSIKTILCEDISLKKRKERASYAANYSWEKPASKILESFNQLNKKNKQKKTHIAWVSPFPPQRSGISNYSELLVYHLDKDIIVDLYYDNIQPQSEFLEKFDCYNLDKLPLKFNNYDEVIYHIGNNFKFHSNIYKYAWNYPSTIVLHDWNIHGMMKHATVNLDGFAEYYSDAFDIYGSKALKYKKNVIKKKYNADVLELPMSDAIAKRSKRVIVHHQWVKEQFIYQNNVDVIALFSYINTIPSRKQIQKFKQKCNIDSHEFVISCFGDVNLNKLPFIQIEAIKKLIDEGYPIKLIFVGKISPETKKMFEQLEYSKYKDFIFATGYIDDENYYSAISTSDLIINLRNPSVGEASLTLAQSLYLLKPVIIGNHNQYNEFPDDIVAGKIIYNGSEIEQLYSTILNFLENKNMLEKQLKQNIKYYVENVLCIKKVVDLYF